MHCYYENVNPIAVTSFSDKQFKLVSLMKILPQNSTRCVSASEFFYFGGQGSGIFLLSGQWDFDTFFIPTSHQMVLGFTFLQLLSISENDSIYQTMQTSIQYWNMNSSPNYL